MKRTIYNMEVVRALSRFRSEIGLILQARVKFSAEHQMEHVRRAMDLYGEEFDAIDLTPTLYEIEPGDPIPALSPEEMAILKESALDRVGPADPP